MAFPVGTPTVTLVGTIPSAVAGAPFRGKLVCKPSAYLVDAGRNAVYPGGGSVTFDNSGTFSVVLLPCDASGIQPEGWRWFLDLQPTGGQRIQFYANITGTGTVHFDDLIPVPAPGGGPGSSGAVSSVNGQVGTVVLGAADVHADPAGTAASAVSAHSVASDPHGDRAAASAALTAHEADTTAVHGISNTALLESQSGAQSKADTAQAAAVSTAAGDATAKVAAHAAATDPHGDRAAAAGALAAHEADTTGVHGIADTTALETATGAAAKVTAHSAASDPHGDRAYADGKLAKSANLADLGSVNTARSNLGLGGAALLAVGTSAGTVAAGDDSRLSNARTPTAHAASHATGGADPITPAAIGAYAAADGNALDGYLGDLLTRVSAVEGGTAFLAGLNVTGQARIINTLLQVEGSGGAVRHVLDGATNKLGLHGATPVAQQTVSGSRADGTALADLLTKLTTVGLITNSTSAGITAPWRRRHLPDPVVADSLYAGTAPSIGVAQTGTPTSGYIKYAPAGVTLTGSDVTGPFTYLGAGGIQVGTGTPDSTYVLPTSRYPNTRGNLTSSQAVWTVAFGTDSRYFQLRFNYQTAGMYRLSIDGRKVTDLMQAVGGTTAGSTHLMTVDLGSAGPRAIRLDFYTVPFGGVFLPPDATMWSTVPNGGRFMGFGDSLTDGSSINTGGGAGTWLHRAGRFLGSDDIWDEARGGTGYITAGSYATLANRVATDVVAWNPSRLVVWAGYNDNGGSQPTISAAAASLYSTIRSGLPGTEVYVIGCWSPTGSPGASITNTDATLRAAAAAASYPFISPITGSIYDSTGALVATHGAWITGTGRVGATTGSGNADLYIGTDAVHPTDAGHIYLARRITQAIRELMAA